MAVLNTVVLRLAVVVGKGLFVSVTLSGVDEGGV